jgi:hypothetical protein
MKKQSTIYPKWMKSIHRYCLFALLCILLPACGSSESPASLALEQDTHIVIHIDEAAPLHRAVEDLQRDFEIVAGFRPQMVFRLDDVPEGAPVILIAGPAWSDAAPVLSERVDG